MFQKSLFNGDSLDDWFRRINHEINNEIGKMSEVNVQADLPALISHFESKYHIDVPVLSEDTAYQDEPVTIQGQSLVATTLHFPFTGDHRAFKLHGRSIPVISDPCTVHEDRVSFPLRIDISRPNELLDKRRILCNTINGGLNNIRTEYPQHQKQISKWVTSAIDQRKQYFAASSQFRQQVSSIVPIRKRDDAIKVIAPTKRQPLPVIVPTMPTAQPNAIIEMAAYEDILKTIQSMVHVFERSPATFRKMKEEDLRMILLVALNGLYDGGATGETFNGDGGKTDILIRHDDKNVFIAECLVWEGQEGLRKKMDVQLFTYATWRDSKLALLVFSRNKGFTEVVQTMIETVKNHPQCIGPMTFTHESGARFRFRRADDPQKEFILTCFAFNVP